MLDSPSLAESFGSTSSSLIERARAHDPGAWERLVRLYSPLVYYWFRTARLRPEDSADVLQEVFRAVAVGIGRFNCRAAKSSFRGWLRAIAQNELRDFLRKQQRTIDAAGGSNAQEQLLAVVDSLGHSTTDSHQAEIVLLCQRALELVQAEFEPQTWQVFWRLTIDGHWPADVAAEFGLSTGAVYKAKSRVMTRLRQELSDM